MKKIYTLCLAAALIFAASCSPMDTPEGDSNPPIGSQRPIIMKSYVITATKDAETKITVADNGSALWEEGDVIRVYNANEAWDVKGYEATMTSGAGEQSATFTFDAPADRNEGFFVAYGVEESTTIDAAKAQLDIVVPAAVATSAKPILAGYTATKDEIGSVDLKAVAAYVKVTLTDEADAVRFFPVNNSAEKLAGTILLGADGSLSTYASDAQVLVSNPDDVFYVNLLPGTLSKGYIIDVQKGDAHMIKSVSYGKEYKLFTAGSFVKLKEIPAFAAATVSGTVSPVTTYTNRENDLSKRLKIYGASTSAVAVSGLSEALASHVEFAGYSCEDKTSTDGVFADDFAIGNHTVTATYNFHCGEVTIPVTSTATGTAIITGLPYSVSNFSNEKNNWTPSNNSIAFKADGIYLYTPTGAPKCTLKTMFYFPANVGVLVNAILSKQSSGLSSYETYVTLGSIKATTGSNKSGVDKKPYSAKGTLSGEVSLVVGCSFGLANQTYNYAVNAIEILYN